MAQIMKALVVLAFLCSPFTVGIPSAMAKADNPLKLGWNVQTKGVLNLAPLVVGKLVIVIPTGKAMTAYHTRTGKIAWTYGSGNVWNRGFSSDGERIYVCLKGGRLAALNAKTGQEVWKRDLGINCQRAQHIEGDTLYVPTTYVGTGLANVPLHAAKLFVLNRFDGSTKWVFKSKAYLLQTPTTYGDTIYVGGSYLDPTFTEEESGSTRIYALDKNTHKVKWIKESSDGVPKKLHATKDGLIYCGYNDFVFSLDAKTGNQNWVHDTANWIPSLVVENDVVYYGSATTIVHALNIKNGRDIWRFNIPGQAFDYLLIKPVLVGDKFYFLSQRGHIYALNKNDGKQLWTYFTDMDARVGLSVGDGRIFIGASNGNLRSYKILK